MIYEFTEDQYVVEPANVQICQFVRTINIGNTKMQQVIAPEGISNSIYADNAVDTQRAGILKTGIVGDVILKEGRNCSISRLNNGFKVSAYEGAGESITKKSNKEFYDQNGINDGNDYSNVSGSPYKSGGPRCSDLVKSINGIRSGNVNIEAGAGIVFEVDGNKITIKKSGTQNLGNCIPDPCENTED